MANSVDPLGDLESIERLFNSNRNIWEAVYGENFEILIERKIANVNYAMSQIPDLPVCVVKKSPLVSRVDNLALPVRNSRKLASIQGIFESRGVREENSGTGSHCSSLHTGINQKPRLASFSSNKRRFNKMGGGLVRKNKMKFLSVQKKPVTFVKSPSRLTKLQRLDFPIPKNLTVKFFSYFAIDTVKNAASILINDQRIALSGDAFFKLTDGVLTLSTRPYTTENIDGGFLQVELKRGCCM